MALQPVTKAQAYRRRMAAQGMRQVNIWAPDARSPRIREEALRQSLLASGRPAKEEAEFLDAVEQDMAQDGQWTP